MAPEMSRKTLNKANLEKLGAEKLAALVMELVQGSAALQRRARMELSAAQGPKEVAVDIRKRFVSLRRATSYIDGRRQRALVKDLKATLAMIESTIAPDDAADAFELLWSFLQLAPSLHARTGDSSGTIGGEMDEAMDLIASLAPRISYNPEILAARILEAVADADHGEFDGIIPATAGVLGAAGLDHLRQITNAWAAQPPTPQEIARAHGIGLSAAPAQSIQRNKQSTRSLILADIADVQGDVDAYMARYSAEQLTYGTIAPDVARRLLDAGRDEEAYGIVTRALAAEAGKPFRMFRHDLDVVYEECLEKLGRVAELKEHLLQTFHQILSARSLRKYLKLLPDFDDMEAEEQALDFAGTYPHIGAALSLLIGWPAHARAARVVLARAGELDGNAWDTLTTAAAALEAGHPLAATVLRRAMIEDTLDGAKSRRYRHAARHLAECLSSDATIVDYGDIATHAQFVRTIRQKHARKYGFWQLVDG